jgi:regulator of replication initiation timing
MEDAFRIAYVDFQRDFMDELKELFFSKYEIELSQIKSDIASIKNHQTRQSVSSNLLDALKKENVSLKDENEALKLRIQKLRDSAKPTFRQLFVDKDQCSQQTDSQIGLTTSHQGNLKSTPQSSASFKTTPFTHEDSTIQANLISQKTTPTNEHWADVCDSLISTPTTKGWAIAAASVSSSVRKPNLSFSSKKKESLNIVLSGDLPLGPSTILKQ